eukprot:CAMPEP_0172534006 /NCGR_PEP_ID=MMETSP1067-20121228/6527_1 /TAXON_ID=265564 ORGANISM="Thalassiosira punctigera, Strain Tpunct2005C2" /NCGR_SAMPLE_ID=MMETSP1067 /ASSEMBLY_ACC=CAM_ASM_000444 /LENGTH=72 /DNA_ID=CAMNT_0013318733 /DNA_START=1 /DNA_END=215 /DNA_ORIENTATION=+
MEYKRVEYEAPDYSDDPPLLSAELDPMPSIEDVDTGVQEHLCALQKTWLDLQDAVMAFENAAQFLEDYFDVG